MWPRSPTETGSSPAERIIQNPWYRTPSPGELSDWLEEPSNEKIFLGKYQKWEKVSCLLFWW